LVPKFDMILSQLVFKLGNGAFGVVEGLLILLLLLKYGAQIHLCQRGLVLDDIVIGHNVVSFLRFLI